MERKVPVWLLALVVLIMLLFTAFFGWAVRSTMAGSDRSGAFGRGALAIASFPGLVRLTLGDLSEQATGRGDRALAVLPAYDPAIPGLAPPAGADAAGLSGLRLVSRDGAIPGYRVLTGMFGVDDGSGAGDLFAHRSILLSPDMEIVRVWDLEDGLEVSGTDRNRAITHGFALTEDLSPIYNLDGGNVIRRLGPCGGLIWEREGGYHHSVTIGPFDGRDVVWTLRSADEFENKGFAALDLETGEDLTSFTMGDLIEANPQTGAFEIRRSINDWGATGNRRPHQVTWLKDPFHTNDIEALPADRAGAFPGFETGDVMISARSPNLVFVVDPETLRLRWYSHGPWIRQHDPDWQPDGRITVFDNRMGRDFSEIRVIDPKSRADGVMVDGAEMGFYTRIRGVHQVLPGGNVLVSSPQQGRVFEVTPDGRVVLEIINQSTDGARSYNITSAHWLAPEDVPGDGRCPG
ncbi:MAG: arylsulfotransferase family protein [Pseudomonadota bacterium]